ncbi:MAG: hypothetical protein JNK61_11005 [Bacteroidia bacterium]|nr:hypothetical protein [Bacteroidia bacterium]HQU99860.1 hypothetical protein [Bacteroidia bacterium]
MKRTLPVVIFLVAVIILAGCDSKTFLRSKKKYESDLQGYWRPIKGTSIYGTSVHDQNVQWKFESGSLEIVRVNSNGSETLLDKGNYSIDTKIDQSFLTTSGFTSRDYDTILDFNLKWTIIQLNNDILDITGRPNNGGQIEIEFYKQ